MYNIYIYIHGITVHNIRYILLFESLKVTNLLRVCIFVVVYSI